MRKLKVLYLLTLFALSSTVAAHASASRDLLIQNKMNCLASHSQQNDSISWNDVCDVSASPTQQRQYFVNEQLDQQEGKGTPQNTTADNITALNPTAPNKSPESGTPQNRAPENVTTPGVNHQNWVSDEAPPDPRKIHKKSNFSYEISTEASSIKYVEHVAGTTFMKEKGDMWGINGRITYRIPTEDESLKSLFFNVYRLEGMFTYGKVNYYGGTFSGIPETFYGISDYMFESRGLIGRDFKFKNESIRLTPYFGFGYRSLFDASYANKPGGYNRRIQYYYVPTGVEVLTKLSHGWSIGADAEYDFFIRGNVTSYWGELGAPIDAPNVQKKGYGLRGSLKLIKSFDRFDLFFEPYVRFWHINNSDVETKLLIVIDGVPYGLQEPDNTSLEIGSKLGVEF